MKDFEQAYAAPELVDVTPSYDQGERGFVNYPPVDRPIHLAELGKRLEGVAGRVAGNSVLQERAADLSGRVVYLSADLERRLQEQVGGVQGNFAGWESALRQKASGLSNQAQEALGLILEGMSSKSSSLTGSDSLTRTDSGDPLIALNTVLAAVVGGIKTGRVFVNHLTNLILGRQKGLPDRGLVQP